MGAVVEVFLGIDSSRENEQSRSVSYEALPFIAVCGGGPAGLFAAEVACSLGAMVAIYEKMPTPGRKLLVAGKGGLNLTHGGNLEHFISQYKGKHIPPDFWQECLQEFDQEAMRRWAAGLGIETFEQKTGRVYPREMKAAGLLRKWLMRLKKAGVDFHSRHSLMEVTEKNHPRLRFETPEGERYVDCDAVILALGGASWPRTGSDGAWQNMLENRGVTITPMQAANCGWECDWSKELLHLAEGLPVKNVVAHANGESAIGELLITRYGIEGGIIYQLGHALRKMSVPTIAVDLKPTFSAAQLRAKGGISSWKLSIAARALLDWSLHRQEGCPAERAKNLPIVLKAPRPIAEAISTAGGVAWDSLSSDLQLRPLCNIFCAGEMIDWEAPTGGYLLQGCFATAKRAAMAAFTSATNSANDFPR